MRQGQALIEQIENTVILPNSLAIWGLGQMGLVVKGPDGILYIDPCLSYVIQERTFPPPLSPEAIRHVDYVLCSHEHIDHFDVETLGPLLAASPQAHVFTTRWCMPLIEQINLPLKRVIFPTGLESVVLPMTTCQVTPIPSAHYEMVYDKERGYRWLGFLIGWNGVTLYFAGDTLIYEGYVERLKQLPQADIAMLPINGRDYYREAKGFLGNLHAVEASQLAVEMEWDLILVGHNDMLASNTIPMGEIAEAFAKDCPRQAYKILQPGEMIYYLK